MERIPRSCPKSLFFVQVVMAVQPLALSAPEHQANICPRRYTDFIHPKGLNAMIAIQVKTLSATEARLTPALMVIAEKKRIPWVNEPKCVTCHTGIAEVDTGDTLYREARGHGNLYCTTCHGSPHAMMPSTLDSDNYQAMQYQNKAKTIGSCGACHKDSKGGTPISEFSEERETPISEFSEEHGGTSPDKATACHVCHTSVSTDTTKWPHGYQWKNR